MLNWDKESFIYIHTQTKATQVIHMISSLYIHIAVYMQTVGFYEIDFIIANP